MCCFQTQFTQLEQHSDTIRDAAILVADITYGVKTLLINYWKFKWCKLQTIWLLELRNQTTNNWFNSVIGYFYGSELNKV